MALTNEIVKQKLSDKFGDQLTNWEEPYGMLTFTAPKELNLKVLQFLYDDETLKFQFLTDLCAVHYPERKGEEIAMVYTVHNLADNLRIRFKVYTDAEKLKYILFRHYMKLPIGWKEKPTIFMGFIL
jgi:NADH-quinone oxidoreductase subunit C